MNERTYAQISLNALEHNINSIKSRLDGKAKLLAIVKADAYGHGSAEVAKFIEKDCDFFGVACIEEALELIREGIKKPMLVLGYVSPKLIDVAVENNIRVPVFSFETAKALSEEAVRQGKMIDFHFCVDTGMSRIGFQVDEHSADMCAEIAKLPNIRPEGIFSHFARADETDLASTQKQLERFDSFISMLSDRGVNPSVKHISNSAGIMVLDEKYDMVRAGIILYGMYPSEDVDKELLDIKPVMQWKTYVSHIKTLEAGREISYGGTYVTDKPTVVATIPVGYADGYPRCLSGKGRVIINGRYANILGRVCMDQFMVDITDIPDVSIEDEVILVGSDGDCTLSMEEVSALAHSFNYELPCRLTRRVSRVYTYNDKIVSINKYI